MLYLPVEADPIANTLFSGTPLNFAKTNTNPDSAHAGLSADCKKVANRKQNKTRKVDQKSEKG